MKLTWYRTMFFTTDLVEFLNFEKNIIFVLVWHWSQWDKLGCSDMPVCTCALSLCYFGIINTHFSVKNEYCLLWSAPLWCYKYIFYGFFFSALCRSLSQLITWERQRVISRSNDCVGLLQILWELFYTRFEYWLACLDGTFLLFCQAWGQREPKILKKEG